MEQNPRLPLLLRGLVLAAVLLVPLRIVGQGFLPPDDALRHAAKAVSGKPWSEILVLRDEVRMDSHPGWHAALGLVHRSLGASAHDLVLLSVVGVFVLVSLGPVLGLRRPEAWLVALSALVVLDGSSFLRLVVGRPFGLSTALFVAICVGWQRLDAAAAPPALLAGLTAAVALCAWAHPSFYLFGLVLVALFLAGARLAAVRLAGCLAAGVVLAALATGAPLDFLRQSLLHPWYALADGAPATALATEFRPYHGAAPLLLLLAGLLRLRAPGPPPPLRDPVLLLAGIGWVLGFSAARFWLDWGAPAAAVWIAREIEAYLEARGDAPATRLAVAAIAAVVFVQGAGSDVNGRYTSVDRSTAVLLRPENAAALPTPGGIVYTDDMTIFYGLFYRAPLAPWRYVLGYEPGLMRPEDLAVYRAVHTARTREAFAPWVARMTPADRMVLRGVAAPPVPELAWLPVGNNLWSGRRP